MNVNLQKKISSLSLSVPVDLASEEKEEVITIYFSKHFRVKDPFHGFRCFRKMVLAPI